jgi:hypothetical protein
MKIPWWVYLAAIAAFGGVLGAGYMYFDYTQKQISTLSQDLGTVKAANELQDKAIATIKEANIEMKRIAEAITDQQADSQEAVTSLERKLTKITVDGQRDLGRLAEARPVSIERIVNDGTKKVFRCVEISTGSKLTVEEKKEHDDTGKIRDCPGLVIP